MIKWWSLRWVGYPGLSSQPQCNHRALTREERGQNQRRRCDEKNGGQRARERFEDEERNHKSRNAGSV